MECNVSELVKRGHEQVDELKSSCGAVDARDVAQLISDLATQLDVQLARSNVLAAENAGIKAAIDATIRWQQSTDPENVESVRMLVDVKTPAIEVILADVMAQGVGMFALMFAEEAIKTNNITTGWRARASRAASEYAEALREDAALLRKGVQS
ncbi:hypothetical protein [Enterobacter hormaechei]|uniref:hypothetical protein n=1 Tax=Enterobacter hormaechei TaxID=158836 RepID=UPI00092F409D